MQEQIRSVTDVPVKAFGHGRELRLAGLDVPAVLVCVSRETSQQAGPVTRAVRETYPEVSQVLVATIADVRSIPKLLRKVVEQLMKSNYNDAVKNLAPGHTAEDYVIIVPDWDGEVLGPLGVDDVTKQIAVAVIAPGGKVALVHQGDEPATAVLEALRPLAAAV